MKSSGTLQNTNKTAMWFINRKEKDERIKVNENVPQKPLNVVNIIVWMISMNWIDRLEAKWYRYDESEVTQKTGSGDGRRLAEYSIDFNQSKILWIEPETNSIHLASWHERNKSESATHVSFSLQLKKKNTNEKLTHRLLSFRDDDDDELRCLCIEQEPPIITYIPFLTCNEWCLHV